MSDRVEAVVAKLERYLADKSWGDDSATQLAEVVAAIRGLALPVTQADVDLLRDLVDMVPRSAIHQSERDHLDDLAKRLSGAVAGPQ